MAASITTSPGSFRPYRSPYSHPVAFPLMAWFSGAVVAGILTVGLAGTPEAITGHPLVLAEWAILVAISGLMSVSLGNGMEISVDLPLLLAAAYLWGPIAAGAMALIASRDRRELRGEVTLTSALFNHAQVSLSVMVAGFAFRGAGGVNARWPWILLPALVGLLADVLVNVTLIVVGTWLKRGTRWVEVLNQLRFGSTAQFALSYLGFGCLAVVLVGAYRDAGAWALAEFAVPLVLARQTFRQGTELEDRAREIHRKQEALRDVSQQIALERQDERARIASALHDDVLQALYNVTLHAEVIREEIKSGRLLALEDDIPRLLDASQHSRALLRDVISGLKRSDLGVGGLASTLRLLVEDVSSGAAQRIEASIDEVGGAPATELLIYQIAREALKNAVRHSSASRIYVQLARDGDVISLLVEDDGRGFIPGDVDADQHFGLLLMLERAQLAGGRLTVRSRAGHGTQVHGLFPIIEGGNEEDLERS